jgi:hypothetical protein
MKYFNFRHAWIPIAAFFLAAVGYPFYAVDILRIDAYVIIFGIAAAMIVVGNLLIVFFPKDEDKEYFRIPHKLLVVGFAIFALSGLLDAVGIASVVKSLFLYVGVTLAIIGIIGMSRKAN